MLSAPAKRCFGFQPFQTGLIARSRATISGRTAEIFSTSASSEERPSDSRSEPCACLLYTSLRISKISRQEREILLFQFLNNIHCRRVIIRHNRNRFPVIYRVSDDVENRLRFPGTRRSLDYTDLRRKSVFNSQLLALVKSCLLYTSRCV